MESNADHTYPRIAGRVCVSEEANPNGLGVIVSQTPWTVVVRMDVDGIDYLFGKNVIDKIGED